MQQYRFLISRRWLGYLAGAIVLAIACVGLGMWQLDRRDQKLVEISKVTNNYDGSVKRLDEVIGSRTAELPASAEWTRVVLHGSYSTDETVLARNRPLHQQSGYEIIVPFVLDSGDAILVDRGWVSTSSSGGVPESVPQPAAGQVTVTAWLRPIQTGIGQGSPEGQITAINPASVPSDSALYQSGYALMQSESPAATVTPDRLTKPSIDEGPHLSYGMQWFCFGLMIFIGYAYAARTEARNRRESAELADASSPATGSTASTPPRRRKRRSAEEEEDAILAEQGF
ncbi:SURF1 family protein [Saxibacter everestensis]|uniref:SURF1-like protein n=1 Tax=Saxibacter everestensis TaxID=2909229 RepID=A0ABY8QXT8_9MICO|nr:SURF1 family protein [Brevibacteriaceae bacterium ZFBP1038]